MSGMNLAEPIPRKAFENVDDIEFAAMVDLLIFGLTIDGAHHKQFFLESALRKLCHSAWADGAKQEFEWEDGIKP